MIDDDIPTMPDDPNHPHAWGRPIVLSEQAVLRAREMMAESPPEWFTKIIERERLRHDVRQVLVAVRRRS